MDWDTKFEELVRNSLPALKPDEPLRPDADLAELGLDSLETVGLLMELEEHYDVVFPDEALMVDTFRTPENLWSTVKGLLGEFNDAPGFAASG